MTDETTFLERVRQAVAAGRAYRLHAGPPDPSIAYLGVEGDLCQRLAAEVDAVGGQALLVDDLPAAADALRRLLRTAQSRTALCWRHPLLEALGLADLLAAEGIVAVDAGTLRDLTPDERRARMLACDVGITSCDAAIAETGTLVMGARPGQERVASLLPPWHIAVVQRRQIVPDLLDALALWSAAGAEGAAPELPSNLTLITGPSKTGDMELQLTTGVHGPAHWRVIVVRS